MRAFTAARDDATPDELWLCEHPPVFTQGLAGKAEHVLDAGAHPGRADQPRRPGHLPRAGAGRGLSADRPAAARHLRQGIRLPARAGALIRRSSTSASPATACAARRASTCGWTTRSATPRCAGADAADPFAGLGKIAALGIKVSRHCTYHGVALNVAMDLRPFERINPCGYAGLQTVDLSTIGVHATLGRRGAACWAQARRLPRALLTPERSRMTSRHRDAQAPRATTPAPSRRPQAKTVAHPDQDRAGARR